MQLAKQLRAAGLYSFPCWIRYNGRRWDKGPAVPKGESWKLTALRPVDDPLLDWSSNVVGVPVPPGVLVLDLDTYKGATRHAVEQYLGGPVPWDLALVQRTIGGGEHYAFKCDWNPKQGDSIGIPGLDTRAAGRGFICSGQGYEPSGFGLYTLAHPDRLPELPASARTLLEKPEQALPPPPSSDAPVEYDTEQVIQALSHIDPGCSRAEWFRVCCALRVIYKDDPYTGQDICERWSSGEWSPGGTPHNYVPDGKGSIADQWPTLKPEGDIQPATLFYKAIQAGWAPPSGFDTAAAFGPGAAQGDTFSHLVERVQESGGDVKQTAYIVGEIQAAGCNALQVALLAAELKNALKDAGIKDKQVTDHIDGLLKTKPLDVERIGEYGKNDTDNAITFLQRFYPEHRLARCDGEFYRYTGKAWEKLTSDTLRGQIYGDMSRFRMQDSRMASCFRVVSNICPVYDGHLNRVDDGLILFDNGVLDLRTGQLHPHDPALFTTNIMPYAWDPSAPCPQWQGFLTDVFSGDRERMDLLQEWFGYLLTRRYDHQKIMFLLGGPRCGKGTIGRILQYLVGAQNFSGGSLSSLAADSFIDGIRTKPVVFIGDAQKKISPMKVNEVIERLKAISGHDEVSWHRMYHGALSETLPTRFTLSANNVPVLFDDSGALASRMLLLTFDKSYLGREDLTLGDRLGEEIAGVAVWALEGLRRLSQNGKFTQPAASEEEISSLQETYSPLYQFLTDVCILDPTAVCTSADIYNTYRAWALNEGEDPLRRKVFVSALKDATRGRGVHYGPQRQPDGNITRGFRGIKPRVEAPATARAFEIVK